MSDIRMSTRAITIYICIMCFIITYENSIGTTQLRTHNARYEQNIYIIMTKCRGNGGGGCVIGARSSQ